jgi:hypothetical protein
MKKVYIQPAMQSLAVQTEGVIAASIGFGEGTVKADDALTKKKESGIWNEGEGSKDGIW